MSSTICYYCDKETKFENAICELCHMECGHDERSSGCSMCLNCHTPTTHEFIDNSVRCAYCDSFGRSCTFCDSIAENDCYECDVVLCEECSIRFDNVYACVKCIDILEDRYERKYGQL
jgi:hypothetical protein